MLTIKTMPMLLKIVGKLDIKPAVEMLKGLDIFEDAKDAKDANDGVKEAEDGNLMSEKLDAAPLKDDSDKGKRKDKKSKK